jgi:dATP/dGTP diphosphohydrolase
MERILMKKKKPKLVDITRPKLKSYKKLRKEIFTKKEIKEQDKEIQEVFKKFDSNKLDLSLCPKILFDMYAEVAMFGEKKYGRNNWKKIEAKDAPRIIAASLRHKTSFMNGEYLDPESGLPHLSHALWQDTTLEYLIRKVGIDEVRKFI